MTIRCNLMSMLCSFLKQFYGDELKGVSKYCFFNLFQHNLSYPIFESQNPILKIKIFSFNYRKYQSIKEKCYIRTKKPRYLMYKSSIVTPLNHENKIMLSTV